jgi:hypothetical protein
MERKHTGHIVFLTDGTIESTLVDVSTVSENLLPLEPALFSADRSFSHLVCQLLQFRLVPLIYLYVNVLCALSEYMLPIQLHIRSERHLMRVRLLPDIISILGSPI